MKRERNIIESHSKAAHNSDPKRRRRLALNRLLAVFTTISMVLSLLMPSPQALAVDIENQLKSESTSEASNTSTTDEEATNSEEIEDDDVGNTANETSDDAANNATNNATDEATTENADDTATDDATDIATTQNTSESNDNQNITTDDSSENTTTENDAQNENNTTTPAHNAITGNVPAYLVFTQDDKEAAPQAITLKLQQRSQTWDPTTGT